MVVDIKIKNNLFEKDFNTSNRDLKLTTKWRLVALVRYLSKIQSDIMQFLAKSENRNNLSIKLASLINLKAVELGISDNELETFLKDKGKILNFNDYIKE